MSSGYTLDVSPVIPLIIAIITGVVVASAGLAYLLLEVLAV